MSKRINFQTGFNEVAEKNKKVWAHDRTQTVGASEVFSCHRQTFFKKRAPELADEPEGIDPEWGHTARGDLIENEFVVPTLRQMFGDERCLFMGTDQKTLVDGRLSATPDGVITDLPDDAMADYGIASLGGTGILVPEVKTFGGDHAAPKKKRVADEKDATKNLTVYEPRTKHEGQNVVQMGILRRKTNYSADVGVVLYINPVNLKDIRPAPVRYSESVYARAKERAEAVYEPGATAKDFKAEGLFGGNDCSYCEFCTACNAIEMERFPDKAVPTKDFDAETQAELEERARKVADLRKQHKALEADKKMAESELKSRMFDLGTTRIAGEGWSASVSKSAGRKTLDKERIAADFDIDLDEYQKEGEPFFVLRTKASDD